MLFSIPISCRDTTRGGSRRKTRLGSAALVALLCVGGVLLTGQAARSMIEYEPIGIIADDTLVPGQPLACQVSLDGPSAAVTIYSDPIGAVSFQGTVQNGATIQADTDPDLSEDQSVTVYAITDGQAVVATTVTCSDTGPNHP